MERKGEPMIVIASDNAVVIEDVSTLLKQKGDLFSVASDEATALAALRADRASLLIADAGANGFDAFGLVRIVREDPELDTIPALCLIEPQDLSALLSVLDCSADGFLSRPFDLGSLTSVIGDLRDRQAEGADRRSVKTRFRITHDGRDYSVTADRREMLEFLIAAFETAVRMRGEHERTQSDLKEEIRQAAERLGTLVAERDATVGNLHDELEERARSISRLNAALQAKEQAESLLKTRMDNISQELKDLGGVLETTRRSEEEKSARIAELTADLAEAGEENARAEQDHASAVRALENRLQERVSELNNAQSTVAGLKVSCAELDRTLLSLRQENTQYNEKIQSLSAEMDSTAKERDEYRDKNTRNAEKIRSLEAEIAQTQGELKDAKQECTRLDETLRQVRAATQAKEQEVRSALDNLNTGLRSLENALEQNLRKLEQELAARHELEKQVGSLTLERDALARAGDEMTGQLAGIRSDLESERSVRISVQTECDAVTSERERLQDVLETTYRDLAKVQADNADLNNEMKKIRSEQEKSDGLSQRVDRLAAELAAAQATIKAEQDLRAGVESKYAALQESSASSRQFLDSASRDIGILNAALADERSRKSTAEERYRVAQKDCADKEREIAALRQELDAVRSAAKEKGPILIGPQEEVPADHPIPSGREPGPAGIARESGEPALHSSAPPVSDSPPGTVPDTGAGISGSPDPVPPAPSFQMTFPPTGPEKGIPVPEEPVSPEGPERQHMTAPDLQEAVISSAPSAPEIKESEAGISNQSQRVAPGDLVISRERWLDITKWAHHTTAVTDEQRKDLIANLMRLSKLVQKGRHLTNRQEQEIRALAARVQSLGYRFV
jgi:chromosome segregation ATPase